MMKSLAVSCRPHGATPCRPAILFRRLALLFLTIALLNGCGGPQQQKQVAIKKEIYDRLLTDLHQEEFIKIASHFSTREETDKYMQENVARFFHAGTSEENGLIYADYIPVDKSNCAGFTLVFDADSQRLRELGLGFSEKLSAVVEQLLQHAIVRQPLESEAPFLSKESYSFGYVPLGGRRLAISIEKSVMPDRSLYSIVYRIDEEPGNGKQG